MPHQEAHNHGEVEPRLKESVQKLAEIEEAGGFEAYAETHEDEIRRGFSLPERSPVVSCSDERVMETGWKNPGSIVFDLYVVGADPAKLAERFHKLGVKTITSHDGCGAAKMAAIKQGIPEEESDAWAASETKDFCEIYDFHYEHINGEEMDPRGHVHPATTIYINLTKEIFDWKAAGLPQGFSVDRSISTNYRKAVEALLGIAFLKGNGGDYLGHDGQTYVKVAGKKRRRLVKFSLVVIAENQDQLASEIAALNTVFGAKYKRHIRVQGFVAPTSEE